MKIHSPYISYVASPGMFYRSQSTKAFLQNLKETAFRDWSKKRRNLRMIKKASSRLKLRMLLLNLKDPSTLLAFMGVFCIQETMTLIHLLALEHQLFLKSKNPKPESNSLLNSLHSHDSNPLDKA